MNSKRLTVILAAVLAICIAALAAVAVITRPDTQSGIKKITVTVIHADGREKVFGIKTSAEYLRGALLEARLIAGTEGPYGFFITIVDGEKAIYEENGAYWSLTVNGQYAQTGIESTPITDGGEYGLVYTK